MTPMLNAICLAVETTATMPFDGPLVLRFPKDEWVALRHEFLMSEAMQRRYDAVFRGVPDWRTPIGFHCQWGEVRLMLEEDACLS